MESPSLSRETPLVDADEDLTTTARDSMQCKSTAKKSALCDPYVMTLAPRKIGEHSRYIVLCEETMCGKYVNQPIRYPNCTFYGYDGSIYIDECCLAHDTDVYAFGRASYDGHKSIKYFMQRKANSIEWNIRHMPPDAFRVTVDGIDKTLYVEALTYNNDICKMFVFGRIPVIEGQEMHICEFDVNSLKLIWPLHRIMGGVCIGPNINELSQPCLIMESQRLYICDVVSGEMRSIKLYINTERVKFCVAAGRIYTITLDRDDVCRAASRTLTAPTDAPWTIMKDFPDDWHRISVVELNGELAVIVFDGVHDERFSSYYTYDAVTDAWIQHIVKQ